MGTRRAFTLGDGQCFQNRKQIFFAGQTCKDAGFLREIAHAEPRSLVHRKACDVFAIKDHACAASAVVAGRVRVDHPDCHAKTGRLARTVAAQQANHFGTFDRERHIAYVTSARVGLSQIVRFEEGQAESLYSVAARFIREVQFTIKSFLA